MQAKTQQPASLLEAIPNLISDGLNETLISPPLTKEVNGSDGFTGKFYSHYWDIVGADLHIAVLDFFARFNMPRSWTSTLIATIPKVETPFKDPQFVCKTFVTRQFLNYFPLD